MPWGLNGAVLLSAFVVLRPTSALYAQIETLQFENLTVEDGLSHPNVRAIVQDRFGFMWFGTEDGLDRYDGYTMVEYKNNPADSHSIPDHHIQCLLPDDNGVLWIGTGGGGLSSFDASTGRFSRHGLDNEYVYALRIDHNGILWVGATDLNAFDRKTKRFITLEDTLLMLRGAVIRSLYEDKAGVLWIGTWFRGLYEIERDRRRVANFRHDPNDSRSLSENHVISIFEDSQGGHWFGTYTGGLNKLDPQTGKFLRFPWRPDHATGLNDNTIRAMYEDRAGNLWLCTSGGGLNILNTKTGEVRYITHDVRKPASVIGDHIYAICKGTSGIVWIGADGGISKYNPAKDKFPLVRVGDESGRIREPAGPLHEDRGGTLWIVHNSGGEVTEFNRRQQHVRFHPFEPQNPHGLMTRYVSRIYEDRRGSIWFGSIGSGVCRLDTRTGLFKTFKLESSDSSRAGNSASAFCEDSNGNLWIGVSRGLVAYDPVQQSFTYHGDYATIPRRDPAVHDVQSIIEERDGTLWLGTEFSGLIKYDPSRGILAHFEHDQRESNSLNNNYVRVIFKDKRGRLWLGTIGGGLDLFDSKTSSFQHLTERDGLLSNIVHAVLEDARGNLWIVSPKGISCFNPDSRTLHNYDAGDGISGLGESAIMSRTGEIVIGSVRGLYVFHPDSVSDNPHIPNVVLTDFSVLNEPFPLPQPLHTTKEIVLDHTQNFISFEFAALDFVAPQKNQHAYMLEGVDNDWIKIGTRRRANYTHLDPGTYIFRVRGSNNDGVWNDVGTSVAIIITPPFWQTWWFRVFAILFFVGLLTLAYNYRVNKLLEVERVRLRIARDLHDELGSNLSAIALAGRMVQEGANLTDEQRHRLSEISESATQTADTMREIVWFINPEHDGPEILLLKMKDVAAAMLGGMNLSFHCSPDVFDVRLDVERRRHLFLIYKEILNNIVKHARARNVEVRLERTGGQFRMYVADDGCGFDPAQIFTGNGLANLRSRAAAIGAELEIATLPGHGTTITLLMKTT